MVFPLVLILGLGGLFAFGGYGLHRRNQRKHGNWKCDWWDKFGSDWDGDDDDRGRDRDGDWHRWKHPRHRHHHRWSRDRLWWWSGKWGRWRGHNERDEDDDDDEDRNWRGGRLAYVPTARGYVAVAYDSRSNKNKHQKFRSHCGDFDRDMFGHRKDGGFDRHRNGGLPGVGERWRKGEGLQSIVDWRGGQGTVGGLNKARAQYDFLRKQFGTTRISGIPTDKPAPHRDWEDIDRFYENADWSIVTGRIDLPEPEDLRPYKPGGYFWGGSSVVGRAAANRAMYAGYTGLTPRMAIA